jgi:hypothetical protein
MATQAKTREQPNTERIERDPPSDIDELLSAELQPGDAAVEIHGDSWYYVLRRSPQPAGQFVVHEDCTLAEWEGCDPEDNVIVAFDLEDAQSTPGVDSSEDAIGAIQHGRLFERAVPESKIVPALEPFGEAQDRGEWNGLADYLEAVSQ